MILTLQLTMCGPGRAKKRQKNESPYSSPIFYHVYIPLINNRLINVFEALSGLQKRLTVLSGAFFYQECKPRQDGTMANPPLHRNNITQHQ